MIYTVTLNPARDRTVTIPDFEAGKVNRIQTIRDDPGGKGINVSKVIHTLGGRSVAMGILGGATGKYIQKSVSEMGIETDFAFTKAQTRTNTKVIDPARHVTTDINEPGAPVGKRVLTSVISRLLSKAGRNDIVVFAGKIPAGANSALIAEWTKKLSAQGARVFLDADSATLAEGVKAAPYLIKPNETELSQLLGAPLRSLSEVYDGARRVMDATGVKYVAVSLGADGALFVGETGAWRAEAIPVNVLSTVGAGDAMMAALAYGFDAGMPAEEAYRWAMAAGAASVTVSGTQSPARSLVESLYGRAAISKYAQESHF